MRIRLLIFTLLLVFVSCSKKPEYSSIFKEDINELCDGDLVFRKGRGTATQLINLADKNTAYSHVGILLKDSINGWYVIHAVPGEQEETEGKEVVKKDPIDIFFKSDRALAGSVYRFSINEEELRKIAEESIRLLEREILFDHSFNSSDTTELYCTELVSFIFSKIGVDITDGRRHSVPAFRYEIIFPSDILKNEKLVEVYSFNAKK